MCSFLLTTLVLQVAQFLDANFYAQKRGPDATTWVRIGRLNPRATTYADAATWVREGKLSSSVVEEREGGGSARGQQIPAALPLSFVHNLLHMTGEKILQPFVELWSTSSTTAGPGASSRRSHYSSLSRLLQQARKNSEEAEVSGEQTVQPPAGEQHLKQPREDFLVRPDLRVAAMFNGEIYNWRDLSTTIHTEEEHILASDGDVLLPLYRKHGTSFPKFLDGEFALAVVDFEKNLALLATDAFGTKPLWYSLCDGGFHAATYESSLKKILPKNCRKEMMPPNAVFVM